MAVKVKENDHESTVIIKTLMRMTGTTVKDLSDALGFEGTSGVSMLLRTDMKYSKFVQVLKAMGYEIKINKITDTTEQVTEVSENQ